MRHLHLILVGYYTCFTHQEPLEEDIKELPLDNNNLNYNEEELTNKL